MTTPKVSHLVILSTIRNIHDDEHYRPETRVVIYYKDTGGLLKKVHNKFTNGKKGNQEYTTVRPPSKMKIVNLFPHNEDCGRNFWSLCILSVET